MRKIPLSASLLTYLEELEYTEAALLADDETHDLAKAFTSEITAWEKVFKTERESRRGVIRAEAVVSVRDAQLDSSTVKFGVHALAEAAGDRKSAGFRRFFPSAPSQYVRQPLRKQCEHTLNVIATEIGKLEKKSPLKALGQALEPLAKAAVKALDLRAKVRGDRASTSNDIDEWKEGVNAVRASTQLELLKLAHDHGHGRGWADAFFRTDEGSSVPTQPDAPPVTPAPSGGSAAATGP